MTMAILAERQELEDGPIDGELLSERDLVDTDEAFGFSLPDGVDQEWLLGELWKDLLRGEHAKEVLAEAEMRRIIEVNRQLDHRFIDGIGQLRCRVSLDTYLHWTSRYGPDFWRDESNLQYFAKRNPGFLVETTHKKSIHVVDGMRDRNDLPAALGSAPASGQGVKPTGGAMMTASPVVLPRVRSGRGRGRWAN